MRNQAVMFTGLGLVKASGQCDPGKTVRSRYIYYKTERIFLSKEVINSILHTFCSEYLVNTAFHDTA